MTTINYDAATREGRINILGRILSDCDFIGIGTELSTRTRENGGHWVDRIFNAGREYQRALDQAKIDRHFRRKAKDALGCMDDFHQFSSEVPKR